MNDLALMAVCDQLTDTDLETLAECAECDEPLPQDVVKQLTETACAVLGQLLSYEHGRRQVIDAVQLEQHARYGGA